MNKPRQQIRRATRCMVAALLVGAFAMPATAAGQGKRDAEPWMRTPLLQLGLTASLRRYSTAPRLDFGFRTRRDQVLTGARLELIFDAQSELPGTVNGLVVSLNGEEIDRVPLAELSNSPRQVAVDERLIGERNTLRVALARPVTSVCEPQVPPGTWKVLAGGHIDRRSTPLPLRNDLANLPLPFYDPDFDTEPVVDVVMLGAPRTAAIANAALIAGWMGKVSKLETRFNVTWGKLPDRSAIVLGVSEDVVKAGLGKAVQAPTLRVVDHPRFPRTHRKILVLTGATPGQVRTAAIHLAAEKVKLRGPELTLSTAEPALTSGPIRGGQGWAHTARPTSLSDVVDPATLIFSSATGGTLRVPFRVAPDLSVWPEDWIHMDLQLRRKAAAGRTAPALHVEFNGKFVQTLPAEAATGGWESVPLRVHRTHLRGFNELLVHVDFTGAPLPCLQGGGKAPATKARVELSPKSLLHLHGFPYMAPVPDLERFIYDGHPFSRWPDLRETVAVLPDSPQAADVSTLLSTVAHLATITGSVGERLRVAMASEIAVQRPLDRDILIVGGPARNGLLAAWLPNSPLRQGSGIRARGATGLSWLRILLEGRWPGREVHLADKWLQRADNAGIVVGFEQPTGVQRTVIAMMGAAPRNIPNISRLQGVADSRYPHGDLMVIDGERRAIFRLLPQSAHGDASTLLRIRWYLAHHWLVVLLAVLLLAGLVANRAHLALLRKEREREMSRGGP